MAKKKTTRNYTLKKGNKKVYEGTTNDLVRRIKEHARDGKKFDRVEFTALASRETARATERESLETYRRGHGGENPKYNRTDWG